MVIRGTTPDYVIIVPNYDLADKTVYVTIGQGYKRLTLSGEDLFIVPGAQSSSIAFSLSQEQTLGLREGSADVQIKVIDANGHVDGSETGKINIGRALLERVVEYGGTET